MAIRLHDERLHIAVYLCHVLSDAISLIYRCGTHHMSSERRGEGAMRDKRCVLLYPRGTPVFIVVSDRLQRPVERGRGY